jgi:hypothetical protein
MLLTAHRAWFTPNSTQGSLSIDGVFFCYTMEPRKDRSQGKPYCIDCGTYEVRLLWSNHFQRITPHLLNVPNFTLIEIHPLNFPHQTEGCLGVGQFRHPDVLGNSDAAFNALMKELREPIQITYLEEPIP